MNVQQVKSAQGCRVRDPKTGNLLPNITDTAASAVPVDLDDPYWFRSKASGDIVLSSDTASAAPATPAAPAAPTAPASTSTTTSAATAPAAKSA